MATATLDGRGEELRRSVTASLAAFGDALLRGPLPRVLLFAAIIVLELALAGVLKARLLSSARCAVLPEAVVLGALPSFVPAEVAAELSRVRVDTAYSVADPELDRRARAAFESHPWVRRVARIRRLYPSRLLVDVELRKPFALVDVEEWRLTVDGEGIVLDDRGSRAPEGLPIVRGDRKSVPRIPRIGRPFKALAVHRGLAVLRDLVANADHRFLVDYRVLAADVTKAAAEKGGDVVLELGNGVRVEWGESESGALSGVEPGARRKLDALLEAEAAHPGFRGVATVNVLSSTPFVRGDG